LQTQDGNLLTLAQAPAEFMACDKQNKKIMMVDGRLVT